MSTNVAIVTDTNSGIFPKDQIEGITLIRMPFSLNGEQYYENESITAKEFFQTMENDPHCEFSTSMPVAGEILTIWTDLLKDHDEIVYIPMSSALSSSYAAAVQLAEEFEGKVQVVNNNRISVTQEQSVYDALKLKEQGKSAKEIKEILEEQKFDSSIYIMVDSLDFLKKGGRVTPAAALLGGMLKIKPILQLQGEKLDSFAKARGVKSGEKILIKALRNDLETRFKDLVDKKELRLFIAYTYTSKETVDAWKAQVEEAFPGFEVVSQQLSLSISCHTGPGCLGIGCARVVK